MNIESSQICIAIKNNETDKTIKKTLSLIDFFDLSNCSDYFVYMINERDKIKVNEKYLIFTLKVYIDFIIYKTIDFKIMDYKEFSNLYKCFIFDLIHNLINEEVIK